MPSDSNTNVQEEPITTVPFEPQTEPQAEPQLESNTQLLSPRPTPEGRDSPIESSSMSLGPPRGPGASGNRAQRRNEISSYIDTANITAAPRNQVPSRRTAHAIALQETSNLSGYRAAFTTALQLATVRKMHKNDLLPEPRSWKHMLVHRFNEQFKVAAAQEFRKLQQKGTFEYIDDKVVDNTETPLPLLWVFKYKFDSDGYLTKFKARLCARGDLQPTIEDTYAATLAAQTFRAMMAIVAAFDLEMRQYDAINAFVNAILPKPRIMECPEGFKQNGKLLRVLRAL